MGNELNVLRDEIPAFVRRQETESGGNGVVVYTSGGLDSTLTARV